MDPSDHPPETAFAVLQATFTRDRLVQLSLAVAVAACPFLYLSAGQGGTIHAVSVTAAFAFLAIMAARASRSRTRGAERRFWRDLMIAYGIWLAIAALLVGFGLSGVPIAARLAIEIGTALFYVLFVRAVESQPHQRDGVVSDSTRRLNLAAIVVFVFGLLTYFWLIPGVLFPAGGEQNLLLPAVYLYATLDALLTLRLLFLAQAARSARWRRLCSLLALTTSTMLMGDLAGSVASYAAANYFYSASMIFVIIAARSRLYETRSEPEGDAEGYSDRSWQTVVYTLILPLVDIAVFRFGLLDPAYRPIRATFVLIWTPLLGAIALLQNRQLEKERRRVLRELQAKNAEMERFSYAVSHDLKAPLVTVQGFLGMLEKDVAAGDAVRVESDIGRIRNAAGSMGRLVDELLELSRIGQVVSRSEEVSLSAAAAEASELLAAEIGERGVAVEISPDLPVVTGDQARLVQVFQNLIENGVKYMGSQSEPRVEIGWRRRGGEPVCYVLDNGAGIDPRYQKTVFDLFSRLETRVAGTGVGLALVKRIVESHGGRIWVESEGQGQGSCFCFTVGGEAPGGAAR